MLFAVYALGDIHRQSAAFERIFNIRSLSPAGSLVYNHSRAAPHLFAARFIIDVFFPLTLAAVAMFFLLP